MGIGSVLTLASFIRSALPGSSVVDNLSARIKSWWWIAFVLVGALLAGRTTTTLLFAAVSFVALREFSAITAWRPADRKIIAACFYIFLPARYVLVRFSIFSWSAEAASLAGLALLPVLTAIAGDTEDYLARTTERLFGVTLCVFCLSYVPALLMLPTACDKRLVMLFLMVITQASDVLQYVWGKTLGRHKIAPQVSPSKTVEGLIGGIVCTTALGATLSSMTGLSAARAAAIALVLAMAGFLGGLVMSAIKRDRGIKDWSSLIPGHGGILDRVDSLWLSAPLYFYLMRAWGAA